MSSNIEEIIIKLYKKKLYAEMDSEIIKKKFETLQKKQQSDEMKIKLNQKITDEIKSLQDKNKSMEEKYKLIENQIKNLQKENEELKKQIQTKSEETETVALCKGNTRDIWDAIERGSLLAVKFYYKDNPENIIKEHASQSTAIHCASKFGHLHIIEFLISKGVEFDKIDSKGDTPLICASLGGHLSVINYLVDKGALINHQNKNKKTALLIAVENNQFDIVKLLIEKGANKIGLLHLACKKGYFDIFKFLLSNGADIEELDTEVFTPLIRAVQGNNFEIVKFLIDKGANNVGALHAASKSGYLDIIKFLLSSGAEIDERDSKGFTPLLRAVEGNNFEIVKFLIDKGANKAGALPAASKFGYMDIIKFLLSKGTEIEELDSGGFTPLMRAIKWNKLDIVKLLIDKGANKAGALHIASKSGCLDIFKFLLTTGAGINEIDSEGFTPLMRAVEGHRLNIVKFLIDKGANKMIKNKLNQTAKDLANAYKIKCSSSCHICNL